jgi:hypothetical protein
MSDMTMDGTDHTDGVSEKKMVTVDRPVVIITTSGDYSGDINLNLSNVQIDRISDLFVKSDIAFLPLYNATVKGKPGREIIVNTKDIAVVIPKDTLAHPSPELRKDADVSVKLKHDLGQLMGKVNLWGGVQQSDRISDLLNFPGKKWLVLYDVSYKGNTLPAAIINIEFISMVED